ncbi:DUF6264 family protein [Galbitalea sp. SE-J8]|uniref:DUF6264 family protein n=1 Tax=Galbitalea sp. SE-J8 TaxID=3054952 RepID=UPI00259CA27D|nr:DUF6264 family protein [Galbitalea sp. SE-J8]MDM4763384.1 DUF6264 family protein [Galbitalea sp. SE-J8]
MSDAGSGRERADGRRADGPGADAAGRERPEYGEYATPEEQAAASGMTLEEFLERGRPRPRAAGAVEDAPREATGVGARPVASAPPPYATADAPRRSRRWDVLLTVVLIGMGTFSTINGIATYPDLPTTLASAYELYGYTGPVEPVGLARAVGIALAIIEPVVLLIAIAISVRRLRHGKVSFFVPLIAGVVVGIVAAALFATVVFSDPGFLGYLTSVSTPTSPPSTN